MNIIYVITGLKIGGAETQVSSIIDKMFAMGHTVTLISLTGTVCISPKSNVEIISLGLNKRPLSLMKAIVDIRRIIINKQPDVVHSHMIHANILTRLVRIFCPIKKLVCTAHSNFEGAGVINKIYRYTNFLSDVFTNVSHTAIDSFIEQGIVKKDEMKCVYNGVDFKRFSFSSVDRGFIRKEFGIDESTKLLLAVGRLTEAKDYPNLLRAMSLILDDDDSVKLIIVGDGELKGKIYQSILDLDLEENVMLVGSRHDVERFMSAADCLVIASRWEGFGLVAVEAFGCGCPVVATDCGGMKEIVGNGVVPVSDHYALAREVMAVFSSNDKVSYDKYREVVMTKFDLDSIARKWISIYKS